MDKGTSKKRIAFLGGGVFAIPSYVVLLQELSKKYEIIIYSEFYQAIKPNEFYQVKSIGQSKLPRRIKELVFAWMIIKDHRKKSFDIIHSHSTYPTGFWAIVIGKVFGVPVAVSLEAGEAVGFSDIGFGDLLHSKRKIINKWVIKKANSVVALTQFHAKSVKENLNLNKEIKIITRGIDGSKFYYSEKNSSIPLKIISVAYLHPIKDQEMLLKCFALINAKIECELIHIGNDYWNGHIQKLADDLGLKEKVQFKGFVPNNELGKYYAEADILLHTSQFESQALVVNEALACGVLVCGTRVGLLSDLENKCCLTVNTGDAEALAQTVLNLIENSQEINRLRKNGYEWTLTNNLQQTVEQHEKLYDELIS